MVKIKNVVYLLLTGVFMILISGNDSFAQEEKSDKVAPFEIYLTQTNEGIDLICEQGCAWKRLAFNTPNKYKPQGINQLGMTQISGYDQSDNDNENFLFTIQKTNEGMSLSSLNGTAWGSLSFSIKNGQKRKLTELGVELLPKPSSRKR